MCRLEDIPALSLALALGEKVDLTIVGPEGAVGSPVSWMNSRLVA